MVYWLVLFCVLFNIITTAAIEFNGRKCIFYAEYHNGCKIHYNLMLDFLHIYIVQLI